GLGDPMLPLLSLFISQLLAELNRRSKNGRRQLPRGVRCIFDEVGNCGSIHQLPIAAAQMRSANLGFALAFQNLQQVHARYHADSPTLIANLVTRISLGGITEDGDEVCKKLGQRVAYRDLSSLDHDGQESLAWREEQWPLLRPEHLRRLSFKAVV